MLRAAVARLQQRRIERPALELAAFAADARADALPARERRELLEERGLVVDGHHAPAALREPDAVTAAAAAQVDGVERCRSNRRSGSGRAATSAPHAAHGGGSERRERDDGAHERGT